MRLGYTARASRAMLRHPAQGVERIRGRIDRRRDQRDWRELGISAASVYGVLTDWSPRLHAELGLPWPCPAVEPFGRLWGGLPPITGAVLPRPLRRVSHTVVWVLRKPDAVATGTSG